MVPAIRQEVLGRRDVIGIQAAKIRRRDVRHWSVADTQNGMRTCSSDSARVVLAGAAVYQLETCQKRVRSFDPTEGVGKLHQRAWIETRCRPGPVERRIVA